MKGYEKLVITILSLEEDVIRTSGDGTPFTSVKGDNDKSFSGRWND